MQPRRRGQPESTLHPQPLRLKQPLRQPVCAWLPSQAVFQPQDASYCIKKRSESRARKTASTQVPAGHHAMKRGAKKRTAKAVLLRPGRRARMMQMADVRKKCKKCQIRPFTPYGQALNGFSGHQGRFFAVLIDGVGAAMLGKRKIMKLIYPYCSRIWRGRGKDRRASRLFLPFV